jgi:hypothetical protein
MSLDYLGSNVVQYCPPFDSLRSPMVVALRAPAIVLNSKSRRTLFT